MTSFWRWWRYMDEVWTSVKRLWSLPDAMMSHGCGRRLWNVCGPFLRLWWFLGETDICRIPMTPFWGHDDSCEMQTYVGRPRAIYEVMMSHAWGLGVWPGNVYAPCLTWWWLMGRFDVCDLFLRSWWFSFTDVISGSAILDDLTQDGAIFDHIRGYWRRPRKQPNAEGAPPPR